MHYGLSLARPLAEIAGAFDIDDVANDVYESNFGQRPHQVRRGICEVHAPGHPFRWRGIEDSVCSATLKLYPGRDWINLLLTCG